MDDKQNKKIEAGRGSEKVSLESMNEKLRTLSSEGVAELKEHKPSKLGLVGMIVGWIILTIIMSYMTYQIGSYQAKAEFYEDFYHRSFSEVVQNEEAQ